MDYSMLYVNTNGDLSFDGPVSAFTPSSFPVAGFPLIAPYWADVDTRGTGDIYYRETVDRDVLMRARDDVMRAFSIRFNPIFVFIATWDRVGHYNSNTERTATFQCVLMTDGIFSYVKFLYADIEWTTGDASGGSDGLGGTPAQAGFDAGDGERFFSIPGSQTSAIININTTSNVGVPGVWTFQVNGNVGDCTGDMGDVPMVVTPRSGHMLGGTVVSITSPCLEETDVITCQFQGFQSSVAYTEATTSVQAACVSPLFSTEGSKSLVVTVTDEEGAVKYLMTTSFYAINLEESQEIELVLGGSSSPLLTPGTSLTVSWTPESVVPVQIREPNSYSVDIVLVRFDFESGTWEDLVTLGSGLSNTGEAEVVYESTSGSGEVVSAAVQVRVAPPPIDDFRRKRLAGPMVTQLAVRWSGVVLVSLLQSASSPRSVSVEYRRRCVEWCEGQEEGIGQRILDELCEAGIPCPPLATQARLQNSGLDEDTGFFTRWSNSRYHPGVDTCFRSRQASPSGYGQQCCYSDNQLVVGHPGGSVDKVAPIGILGKLAHYQEDVRAATYCCSNEANLCNLYFEKRPSDDGSCYDPPNPACVYGDPHIVTLDGLKYTFNGLGEFDLIIIDSKDFTLQGRMVQTTNPSGELVDATVFSAIVAKEGDSDTVQLQVGSFADDPEALRNGEFIDFTEISSQELTGVVASKSGNVLTARFDSGIYIEVREENGFLSTLLVAVPASCQGQVTGLMGNFNGDISDDLVPRGGSEAISADSSFSVIHNQFGLSWIVSDASDSLSTYPNGTGWSSFYQPNFTPAFEVTFSDPSLEQMADDLCGDDLFCRFDISATENPLVGLSTLMGAEEFDSIVNSSEPVVCVPACVNGACVATNSCRCAAGYSGDQCDVPEVAQCDVDLCENGGTCEAIAGSSVCTCLPSFTGISCQTEVVPLFSGSGSGSGDSVLVCPPCEARECTVAGTVGANGTIDITGTQISCSAQFGDIAGSGSDIQVDDSFSTEYLSASSFLFLKNLNVISGDLDFDCTAQNGSLERLSSEGVIEVIYRRADESFASVQRDISDIQPVVINDAILGGEIDQEAGCMLLDVRQWLDPQASQETAARCRSTSRGVDVLFTIDCPSDNRL